MVWSPFGVMLAPRLNVCNEDNCYRNLIDSRFSAEALTLCPQWLSGTTTSVPADFNNCADVTEFSSACSCVATPTPTTTTPATTAVATTTQVQTQPASTIVSHDTTTVQVVTATDGTQGTTTVVSVKTVGASDNNTSKTTSVTASGTAIAENSGTGASAGGSTGTGTTTVSGSGSNGDGTQSGGGTGAGGTTVQGTGSTTTQAGAGTTQTIIAAAASNGTGLSSGAIAGIAIGCIVLGIALAIIAWLCVQRRRQLNQRRGDMDMPPPTYYHSNASYPVEKGLSDSRHTSRRASRFSVWRATGFGFARGNTRLAELNSINNDTAELNSINNIRDKTHSMHSQHTMGVLSETSSAGPHSRSDSATVPAAGNLDREGNVAPGSGYTWAVGDVMDAAKDKGSASPVSAWEKRTDLSSVSGDKPAELDSGPIHRPSPQVVSPLSSGGPHEVYAPDRFSWQK